MGLFAPANADAALAVLDMMDFEGIEKVRERVQQNGTLYTQLQQAMEQLQKLSAIIDQQNGTNMSAMAGAAAQAAGTTTARSALWHNFAQLFLLSVRDSQLLLNIGIENGHRASNLNPDLFQSVILRRSQYGSNLVVLFLPCLFHRGEVGSLSGLAELSAPWRSTLWRSALSTIVSRWRLILASAAGRRASRLPALATLTASKAAHSDQWFQRRLLVCG